MTSPTDWWVLDLPDDPAPGHPSATRATATDRVTLATGAGTVQASVWSLIGDTTVSSWIGEAGTEHTWTGYPRVHGPKVGCRR